MKELQGYQTMLSEQKHGAENSRIDWLLTGHATLADAGVEVKNVTLLEQGQGKDTLMQSRTLMRYRQELQQWSNRVNARCCCFMSPTGIDSVRVAKHIDPTAELLQQAKQISRSVSLPITQPEQVTKRSCHFRKLI